MDHEEGKKSARHFPPPSHLMGKKETSQRPMREQGHIPVTSTLFFKAIRAHRRGSHLETSISIDLVHVHPWERNSNYL